MNKVVVVTGATAVGKTDFSFELADKYGGEIVCADSAQIYKYMDIGTAKPSVDDMKRIRHHLFDFVDPRDDYSVSDYKRDAHAVIRELHERGIVPIVVGGTGLYIHSLLYKMDFNAVKPDMDYRKQMLEKNACELCALLERQGIELTSSDRNNKRRLVRMLEILKSGGELNRFDKTEQERTDFDVELFVLERDREFLYERINRRVDKMLEHGLVHEVEGLLEMGVSKDAKSMQAIGYKEVVQFINGDIAEDEMVEMLKRNTRRYAKRQITWFKRYDFANVVKL